MTSEEIVRWADRVIHWGFLLMFFLVPLIMTPWNYELFEFNKMMTVFVATAIICGAWLIKMVTLKQFRVARTPLDIPILLFVSSQLISTLFSIDPHVSWFGYYSRVNGGMWSVISYTLLYYAFVSNYLDKTRRPEDNKTVRGRDNKNGSILLSDSEASLTVLRSNGLTVSPILKVLLASATTVALYGVAEHFGIDKHLWVQDVQARVFSTLGQPNWLAAFLVALIPLAMAQAVRQFVGIRDSGFGIRHILSKTSVANLEPRNSKLETRNSLNPDIGHWSFRFVIWTAISLLFFLTLLYTRSRSGLIGFAIADVVFWGFLLLSYIFQTRHVELSSASRQVTPQSNKILKQVQDDKKISRSPTVPFVIFHVAFVILIFFNGTHIPALDRFATFQGLQSIFTPASTLNSKPSILESTPSGTLLETGGTESGTIRKYVWQAAIVAWQSTPKTFWIGTGTETFYAAFYQYKPKGHNLTSEWDFLYNKAHNEYLNYLATTGLFGLGSYLLLIGVFIGWFIKSQYTIHNIQQGNKNLNSSFDIGHWLLVVGLFTGWLSILVTNFFGFSVVVVQLLFFLFPAFIIVSTRQYNDDSRDHFYKFSLRASLPKWSNNVLLLIVLLSCVYVLFSLALRWQADRLFARGYRLNRAGKAYESVSYLRRAALVNPGEPLYADELGTVAASLSFASLENGDATASALYAEEAVRANRTALSISPYNVNFWKSRTKIYYTFAMIDPSLTEAAIDALNQAHELSPQDPKILYNIAVLYGKDAKGEEAIDALTQAIDIKSNYKDAYIALSIFYREGKQYGKAKEILNQYLSLVNPNDTEVLERLKE